MLLKCFKKLRIIITSVIVLTSNQALAQITPDATLPNNSAVRLQNNTLFIEGGTQAGSNLFHSFQEFSVPNGSTAHFQNAINIQNILTRVTGNSISDINGLIKADGTANLFLINPNGIIFGKDAKLAIGGSFFSTTANSMKFSDGFEFNAKNPQPTPLLTINVPIGLQFGSNPGDISINGSNLEVKPGKGLTLVGGNLSVNGGQLKTSGGSIELGGQTEAGNVTLGINGNNSKLGFPENIARADLLLTNNARVSVEAAGGGNIAAYARNIEITGGSTLSAGIGIDLGTTEALAGDITLNATGEIKVAGSDSGIINEVRFNSKGNGGDITIDTGSFKLEDGARLSASTFGTGNAGNVKLTVIDAISLKDGNIFSTVEEGGVGKGGNIDINAANLTLRSGAQLQTATIRANNNQPGGKGDAGNVNVNVTGLVDIAGKKDTVGSGIISSVGTAAEGNGGNITIDAGSFKLEDGAQLIASTFGTGNAGNVSITAIDAVSLKDDGAIFSTVEAGGVGKGGNIDINAATLTLRSGAQLLTATREASSTQAAGRGDAGDINVKVTGLVDIAGKKETFPSGFRSNVGAGTEGSGGNITIDAGSLKLEDGAQISASTFGIGDAGNVKVTAIDAISLANNSYIFSTVEEGGVGKGGDIDINAATLSLRSGAQLQASTSGLGNAGNVRLIIKDGVSLKDDGVILSTVEAGGVGKGGNIDINAATLTLRSGAQLLTATSKASSTQAAGRGDAGDINVKVTGLVDIAGKKETFPSGFRSNVRAGTEGSGGNITIDAGSLKLEDGAALSASTFGTGDAGNVSITAIDAIYLANNSYIFSTVEEGGVGKGGNIDINAATLSLRSGAQLQASTSGLGNAGNVRLTIKDGVSLKDDGVILSTVEAGGVGKGGNIHINAATLTLRSGAQLLTATREASGTQAAGRGDAGDINVKVTGAVDIAGKKETFPSGFRSDVGAGTEGSGGNITIDAGSFKLEDGAALSASTFGTGDAGNVKVTAIDAIYLANNSSIFSTVEEGGVGKGGNIDINAANLTLRSGAQLQTATIRANNNQPGGKGDAGNVNVNVTGLVDIAGKKDTVGSGIISSVGTAAEGNGGNITIDAGSFKLEDGARLSASTFGTGNAGNVKLTAIDAISLANNSYIFSTVEEGGVGKGGDIDINAATLSLQNGAVLLTLTREASETQPAGKGDAGNVNVKVTGAVDIAGVGDGFSSGIRSSVETGTEGNGGNIYIDADSLKLRDGAILNARTLNNNRGGNITVKTNLLEVLNGGQLITTSASGGYAGKITVEATQNVITSGSDQNYSDRVAKFPDRVFNIGASSGLFVSSTGSGIAGDIEVNSPKITLDRAGRLSAESQSGDGGNIVLNLTNLLLLRREAFISATAGTDNKGGNGGNITINAKNGFIVAGQNENTDIIANAFTGKGGQVNINARNIFNIQSRSRSDLVRENVEQLNPRNLLSNDITAISQENPNLSNEPNINTPDTDPTQGLVRLNVDIIDVARLIDENVCVRTANSSFTITGRGGIPSSPDNPAVSNFSWEDWRLSQVSQQKPMSVTTQNNPISSTSSPTSNQIIEAQGWVIDSDGTVILTAAYPASPSQNHILSQCHF
ncbi:filamentous hemagglutinin outer membrane protein [Calothrix sp. NIES-4105]|nr:filamentous hemagglutinin outer membrane protein [Calothrix sp. NIES-4105]